MPTCIICGEDFRSVNGQGKYCKKSGCQHEKREATKAYLRKYRKDGRARRSHKKNVELVAEFILPKPSRKPCPCGCGQPMMFNRFRSPNCPQFRNPGIIMGGKVKHNGNHITGERR